MNKVDKIVAEIKQAAPQKTYPSKEEADYLMKLTKALNSIPKARSSFEHDLWHEIEFIRKKYWNFVFGNQSPWSIDNDNFVWDKIKADKLGLFLR